MAGVTDTLVGQDTIVINGRALSNLGYGKVVDISIPAALVEIESGKDGSAIYAMNQAGRQAEVKIRVLAGSADDVFLNNINESFKANFAGSTLVNASFVKRTGDGQGNITTTTWVLSGGAPGNAPADSWDVNGNTEQALMEYSYKFARATRQLS